LNSPEGAGVLVPGGRLSDTVLAAFHQACDLPDIEVASELLHVLDFMAIRHPNLPTGRERRVQEGLVAAYERLWQIRHSDHSIVHIGKTEIWRLSN
jgi:hypothetical protein